MIAGLVNDGTLSFDDHAHKYLDWWTKDPSDPRSRITLKHLLSFTSGYLRDGIASPFCGRLAKEPFLPCAKSLYENLRNASVEPGTTWTYLGCHLQFAGAMAVAASGLPIFELFERYLYRPFGMTNTTWTPHDNPQLAVGITTTAHDFESLLHGLLTYAVLPRRVLDVMEMDYSQPPVAPSGDGWFGHYGMGHWWECIGYGTPIEPYERLPLPDLCMANHIQAGPGLYGYYPLIDRSGGGGLAGVARPPYYFQVALAESTALSGIPEYLRIIAKPLADLIMNGTDLRADPARTRRLLLAQGGVLLRRDLDDIRSALRACACARRPLSFGEPYKSLAQNLSADLPQLSRLELMNRYGEGLTLVELAEIQQTLGKCECRGRRGP